MQQLLMMQEKLNLDYLRKNLRKSHFGPKEF